MGADLPRFRHYQIDAAQPAQREHGLHMGAVGRQIGRERDDASAMGCRQHGGPSGDIGATESRQHDELQV